MAERRGEHGPAGSNGPTLTGSGEAPQDPPKTFKRELAVVMLIYLAAFFVWGVWVETAREAARFLTLPIFTFAGGAFGMDAWAKQVKDKPFR